MLLKQLQQQQADEKARRLLRRESGRIAVARHTLEPGTVVLRSAPYAAPVLHAAQRARRCANCFRLEADLLPLATSTTNSNSNSSKPGTLQGCSGCCGILAVQYCSRACQRSHFVHHKHECGAQRRAFLRQLPDAVQSEVLLVCRTLRASRRKKKKQQQQQQTQQHKHNDDEEYVQSTYADVQTLELHPPGLVGEQERAERQAVAQYAYRLLCTDKHGVVSATPSKLAGVSMREIQALLQRFECNNFAIVDALFLPIGAGLYPYGALLNHSCEPNCVITYDDKVDGCNGSGIGQMIRCTRRVLAGEELTHSYIDTCATVQARRDKLRARYKFV
jgi:SET and MYND domain-containing protein